VADQTGRESDKFMLRLPDGMRDRIKAVAAENGRSMNAEIVATLEKEYPVKVSQEMLCILLDASTDLLDAMEEMLPNNDQATTLRDYLIEARNSANNDSERQQKYEETLLVFDKIAKGLDRIVNKK
jgi:plasmid stability protein